MQSFPMAAHEAETPNSWQPHLMFVRDTCGAHYIGARLLLALTLTAYELGRPRGW